MPAMLKLLVVFFVLAATVSAPAPSPDSTAANVLSTLGKEHPRLLATQPDFRTLRETIAKESLLARWSGAVIKHADELLDEAPSKYELPDGKRLLATSRRVLDRALTLGMGFRLTSDRRYSARLWRELDAVANFK